MELEYRKLSPSEIAAGLGELDGWDEHGGQIFKTFGFDNYLDGIAFASAVGYLAEKLDHHPDLEIGWRKVKVSMNTHSVEGISPYDFELAKKIEALVAGR
jgi:4a-hydroxytetrahydrobiopterin dehydratase